MRLGAAAAHFGRDLDFCLARILTIVEHARAAGVDILALPDAALGGYLADLRRPDPDALPPALDPDDAIFDTIATAAGPLTVALGYCERGPRGERYNSAVCLNGDGVLGRHRKMHQPPGERLVYSAGALPPRAFETPAARVGMLIDYDKTFPEAARTLALDGAEVLLFLSAWPASQTARAPRLVQDRQTRLFDLYDAARAAENQVVVASSNQTGVMGGLRFLGGAKIVGPGGEVLARTGTKGGLAVAEIDLVEELGRSRKVQNHLSERRPELYS